MTDITTAQFEELLQEQTCEISKWADLKKNKIFKVTDTRLVTTEYGESLILKLSDNTEVWAPEHMKKKVKEDVYPFYFRPLGLKPCKNN